MINSRETKYERGGSRDAQFEVWKLSRISEERKSSLYASVPRQSVPMDLDDIDELLDGMMMQDNSIPRKLKGLHLSIKQTRILATLLPNAIINISELKKDRLDTFVGVLLFADVSGFTALCEKYNGFGKSGSDKLTATLNNYLGAMVEVIYNNGGDVVKFSGDALLALWRLDKNQYMYSLIHRVICCALYIQNRMGVYETDVKILLKVKLAISAGNMTFCVIGDDNSRHYLVVGSPVYEVKSAEQACTSGDVVLSFSAWGHLSPVNYEHYWKDDIHVKISRVIYNPENSKREILRSETKGSFHKHDARLYNYLRKDSPKRKFAASSSTFHVREDAMKRELCSELRTFLIPSVIQQIDADLPMEYLSEMRNVTIMFINIIPNKLNARKIINMVDKAYIIICSSAYKAKGSVNKVSLFDKDVMVLVIFGLRGFNHEGEAASCLRCGFDIRQACCTLDGVLSVSVGVTTGQAYCGVVGHPLRREYTVMGAVVNKAARIMCAYPGMVACDNDTFLFSNMPASFFTLQEKRYLKGIEDTGPIYEFTLEKSKNTLAAMNEGMYPILGREKEIQAFQNVLHTISSPDSLYSAILVTGPVRIGKSRLLDEMILEAHKNGFPPVAIALHPVHLTLEYGAVQCIIKQVLAIPDSASVSEKERRLSFVLRKHAPATDYWYLNEIMNVKFQQGIADGEFDGGGVRPVSKFEKIKALFHIILTMGTTRQIFAIDDIDYCDELSWKLILSVVESKVKFLIMTMAKRPRRGGSKHLEFPPEIEQHVLRLPLVGLPDSSLAPLACQVLNAKAVPFEVVRVLIARSFGNPGWCESFLLSHSQNNVLKVEYIAEGHVKKLGLIIPPESDLERKHYPAFSHRPTHEYSEGAMPQNGSKERAREPEDGSRNMTEGKLKFVMFTRESGEGYEMKRNEQCHAHVEEAYQDLIQRIQMVRSQILHSVYQTSAEVLNEQLDKVTREPVPDESLKEHRAEYEVERVKEVGATKKDSHASPGVHQVRLFGIDEAEPHRDDIESESDMNLRERIEEIRQRFSRRRYSPTVEETKPRHSSGEISVTKSLEGLVEESGGPQPARSRSAGLLTNRKDHFAAFNEVLRAEHYMSVDSDYFESLPSTLWKTYTQGLIEESVRIFAGKKAKSGKSSFRRSSKKSWPFGSESFVSFRTYTSRSLSPRASRSSTGSLRELPAPETRKSHDSVGVRASHSRASRSESPGPKAVEAGASHHESLKTSHPSEPVQGEEVKSTRKSLLSVEHDSLHIAKTERLKVVLETEKGSSEPSSSHAGEERKLEVREIPRPIIVTGSLHGMLAESLLSKQNITEPEALGNQSHRKRRWITKLPKCLRRLGSSGAASELCLDLPDEREEGRDLMPAILVNPNVNLEDTTPERFAGVVMSAFDCLRPYEQLMLKCGSTIGEKFTRKMLNAIMHDPNPFLTAEAVKRLFEMRILVCGLHNGINIAEERSSSQVSRHSQIQCSCPLTDDDIVDDTLPRYSYCRVLLFRYATFRSTLYSLIPLDQKREFHIRAVEFLERENIICSSCEVQIKTDIEFTNEIFSGIERKMSFEDKQVGHKVKGWNSKRDKKKEFSPLVLPSLLPNFQKCECLLLRADIHKQLISHCIGAGLRDKEIEFLIRYISIIISLGEYREASTLLEDAELLVKTRRQPKHSLQSPAGHPALDKKERKIFLGRIYLLQGTLKLELGALKRAKSYLITSLKHFGCMFKTSSSFPGVKYLIQYLNQWIYQKHSFVTSLESNFCHMLDGKAICLSLLSNIYMLQGKWTQAKVVALRSLNILRLKNDNFIEMCNAYSNAIDIYQHLGDFKFCRTLEIAAARCCSSMATYKTALEMIAFGRLNCSILNARLISGYLLAASKLGESAINISHSISYSQAESYIVPKVVQTMLMIGKLNKAAGLILLLPTEDLWHHILSLEFILQTGYAIKSSEMCLNGIWNIISSGQYVDLDVQRSAVAAVYLWMMRLGRHKEAEIWSKKLPPISDAPMSRDTNNMFAELKILEGDMLSLFAQSEQESRRSRLREKVISAMKRLDKSTKRAAVMQPRVLHLRAYYTYRTRTLSQALEILGKAKQLSISQRNLLEQVWISHSKKVWTNKNKFDVNYWTEAAANEKFLEWTESCNLDTWKNYMFSLE